MTFLKTAALAAMLGITATTGIAQEVTLRFQHFVSPNSANPKYFLDPWVEKVEAEHGTRRCCVERRSGFDFEDSLPQGSSRCSNAFSPLCWKRYVRISV